MISIFDFGSCKLIGTYDDLTSIAFILEFEYKTQRNWTFTQARPLKWTISEEPIYVNLETSNVTEMLKLDSKSSIFACASGLPARPENPGYF